MSVVLSTARTVLRSNRRSTAHCLLAEGDAVRLDTGIAAVDVLSFLDNANRGLRAWRNDRPEVVVLLRSAEASYADDFLEEDPVRGLGDGAARGGSAGPCRRTWRWCVQAGAGGHGEARRRYRPYVARMAEIDVEPRPFFDASVQAQTA